MVKTLFDPKDIKGVKSHSLKILSTLRLVLFIIFGVLTFGILWLLAYWFPAIYYLLYQDEEDITKAEYILFEKLSGAIFLEQVKRCKCRSTPLSETRDHRFTQFEGQIYYFSVSKEMFRSVKNKFQNFVVKHPEKKERILEGLSRSDVHDLTQLYGRNALNFDDKSVFRVSIEEIFGPVFFIQIVSSILFFILGRKLYAIIVLLFVSITVYIRIKSYIQNRDSFQKISTHKDLVKVRRQKNGLVIDELIDNRSLTVGDIVHVDINKKFTCDMLLIEGNCLVNESMLTGETIPLNKVSYLFEGKNISPSNLLLSGTFSVHNKTTIVKALIIGTGWNTSKGRLLGNIVFRERVLYRFEKDFFIMLAYLFIYNMILAITVISIELTRETFQVRRVFLRVLEFIKNGFPPNVFFVSVANIQQSKARLSAKFINTLTDEKIIEAGAIKVICFDKTGTLTETGVSFQGFLLNAGDHFEPLTNTCEDVFSNHRLGTFVLATACCHSLNDIEGQVIGDPLDEQMFKFSGATLNLVPNSAQPDLPFTCVQLPSSISKILQYKKNANIKILKTIDFTSERKRISVLVENENTDEYSLLSKGAPEMLSTLCKPESLPSNYQDMLSEYTRNGLRIISLAYKNVSKEEIEGSEEELEKDLEFLGFLVFNNPIKPKTSQYIRELKEARHKVAMITGDNIYTGINIGLKSDIIAQNQNVYVGTLSSSGKLNWEMFNSALLVHNQKEELVYSRLRSIYSTHEILLRKFKMIQTVLEECEENNIKIALSGDAFEYIMQYLNEDIETKNRILKLCSIFGRCTATQKKLIIEHYKEMLKADDSYVAFVGDGSNDSMALKAANVGLSIGNDESAFSASFFSSINDISPLREIIIEGKSCLSNALNQFKFIMAITLFSNTNYFTLYFKQLDFPQSEFIVLTFYSFPIAYFMGFADSVNKLTAIKLKPYIIHKAYLLEFFSFAASMVFCYIINALIYSSFVIYKKTPEIVDDFESSAFTFEKHFFVTPKYIFFNLLLFICTSGITNHKSTPFKKSLFTNIWFMIYVSLALSFAFFMFYFDILNPFGQDFERIFNLQMRYPNFDQRNRLMYTGLLIFEACAIILLDKSVQNTSNIKLYKILEKKTLLEDDYSPRQPKMMFKN